MLFKRAIRCLAAVAVLVAVAPAPALAATALSCDYTFTAWHGGFSADLKISNAGPPLSGWTARWTLAEPTTLGSFWSARMAQPDADHLVAENVSYNAALGTGASVTFGWTASAPTTSIPTDITVNGARCAAPR